MRAFPKTMIVLFAVTLLSLSALLRAEDEGIDEITNQTILIERPSAP